MDLKNMNARKVRHLRLLMPLGHFIPLTTHRPQVAVFTDPVVSKLPPMKMVGAEVWWRVQSHSLCTLAGRCVIGTAE